MCALGVNADHQEYLAMIDQIFFFFFFFFFSKFLFFFMSFILLLKNNYSHCYRFFICLQTGPFNYSAQSTGAIEYYDCVSASGVRTPSKSVLIYDINQSDGVAAVMQELWEIQSMPLVPLLPNPFWLKMVTPDRVLS